MMGKKLLKTVMCKHSQHGPQQQQQQQQQSTLTIEAASSARRALLWACRCTTSTCSCSASKYTCSKPRWNSGGPNSPSTTKGRALTIPRLYGCVLTITWLKANPAFAALNTILGRFLCRSVCDSSSCQPFNSQNPTSSTPRFACVCNHFSMLLPRDPKTKQTT
jgi:hypothetical protein